jgi:NADH-quinone oxidoreductase subunit C
VSQSPDSPDAKPGEKLAAGAAGTDPGALTEAVGTENLIPAGTELVPLGTATLPVVEVRRGMFGAQGSGDTSGYGGLVRLVEMPPPATRPYGGWYDEVTDELELALVAESGVALSDAVESVVIYRDELTYTVRREFLLVFVQRLRDEPALRFEVCLGVTGVHYPHLTGKELHAVYNFLSMTHNRRVRVEVSAPDDDAHIPSIVSVYPTNDWHEREAYDMFGIVFDGHPSLTRILMPDDWPGHPQRKDYPLGGIPVEYKGATVAPPDHRRSYS